MPVHAERLRQMRQAAGRRSGMLDAEVLEERLASSGQAGPSYGPQYLYSAPRLERRLGPDFARSIPSVCALMQSLRCG